eukprot:SM000146S00948  [mRNA]  locus=s146:97104:98136:+ [translate_table: standard]
MRKQYTIQHGENDMVQKELELLEDDAAVYKLIGPVLVRQDLVEARANVAKRIEYITAEQKRLDATLKQLEERQDTKRDEVGAESPGTATADARAAADASLTSLSWT